MKDIGHISFYGSLLPIVVFLGLWELAARLFVENPALLPPFSAVMREFLVLMGNGVLAENVFHSLVRVMIGFVAGSMAGLIMGIMMGWKEVMHRSFHPVFSLLYPIPALLCERYHKYGSRRFPMLSVLLSNKTLLFF